MGERGCRIGDKMIQINTTFDFRTDTPEGKDPDKYSPTLRSYHKHLWSKPLPGGAVLTLVDTTKWSYLHHQSDLGEFHLTSDTMNASFQQRRRLQHLRDQVPQVDMSGLMDRMYSIGNMILFPGRQVNGKMTINQARGCNGSIADRFDLTLECIRRHYADEDSPLAPTLDIYADFFALFGSFDGYVEFFMLQDLLSPDGSISFYLPFEAFGKTSPLPGDEEAFTEYVRSATNFIVSRNRRILDHGRP